MSRNPFLVVENFISPLTCEDVVDIVDFDMPNVDENGKSIMSIVSNETLHTLLSDDILDAGDFIEEYYGVKIKGIHPVEVEVFPEGCETTQPVCENSVYTHNGWTRCNNKDFIGIIFLNDFREKTPFDLTYEVKGGKLQFPTHGFGFNSKRGTLVIFPGNEYFIRSTGAITLGQMHQVVLRYTCEEQYNYDNTQFSGNYEEWFG